MASVGIRFGSDRLFTSLPSAPAAAARAEPSPYSSSSSSSSSSSLAASSTYDTDRASLCKRGRLASVQPPPLLPISSISLAGGKKNESRRGCGEETAVACESMDSWVSESVQEIVRNLKEAPLLVHVYKNGSGSTTVETEKAVEGDWPEVMKGWEEEEENPVPEGLIFVDELEDEGEENDMYNSSKRVEEGVTKAWGIIVQGRGVDCNGPVCYLLKTSKVGSSGVGLCCTHFCLKKVSSFRETTRSQFKNLWLVSPHA